MPLEGAFLIQLTSNFMTRLNTTIEKGYDTYDKSKQHTKIILIG